MTNIRNLYITFKVTLKCNLACKYCYGRENNSIGAEMSDAEIRSGLQFAYRYALAVGAKSLMICWHGGEPLLLSKRLPRIIEYANQLFKGQGIAVSHNAQTNATLLTPRTYPLIRKYFNSYIGVSLDLFSSYRTFRSGKNSTPFAIDNIDKAIAAGIRCGAINLITKDNLEHIPEIYDFYKQRKMNVRLARVFPISVEDTLASPMYVSDEEAIGMHDPMAEQNKYLGNPRETDWLWKGGDLHLNGNQALAYARLRYVGNSDWESMSLLQIDSLLNDVLPNVHTDMTDGEIASILLDVFDYLEYDVQEVRIPADGYYSNEIRANMDVLLFNANANAAIIQKVVYGDCSTVEEAIAEYQEETGDYYAYTYMY